MKRKQPRINQWTDLDSGIQQHLNAYWKVQPRLTFIQAALCYCAIGEGRRVLTDCEGDKFIAKQFVRENQLEPFVEYFADQSGDNWHPIGSTVRFGRDECRVIGRRKVTIFAMVREDDFEIFLEDLNGKSHVLRWRLDGGVRR